MRPATETEVTPLSHVLARAFDDDPVMEYLFEPSDQRPRRIAKFMAQTANRDLAHGEVHTTGGLHGAAIWCAPDQWKLGLWETVKLSPSALGAFRSRLPRALRVLGRVEKAHPKAPHWYLAVLGTDPEHQGKGIGSALLQPVLERCDTEGLPAYLESSKERNIPFYARHGFEITEEVAFPDGPRVWGMWREPRS